MIITSISLDGIDLTSGNYQFHLSGFQDSEKDIVANDLFSDGQAWGRSKTKAKTLVLEGYILSGGEAAEWDLNRVLAPNKLKTLIINQKYQCQVEVTNRGSTADNSHAITVQLTMPDPYLYAMDSVSTQLGAQYSTGVVFGTNRGVTFGPRKNLLNPATGSLIGGSDASDTTTYQSDISSNINFVGSESSELSMIGGI